MPRYNDTANQALIAAAAATIVNRATYDNLPDAAKAATRRAWQAQLRAQTGCTEKTARKHIRQLCG